jgi:hypothetical protein
MQTGVNDLETMVTKSTGNDLCSSVMAVQAWLGNYYSIRALHRR